MLSSLTLFTLVHAVLAQTGLHLEGGQYESPEAAELAQQALNDYSRLESQQALFCDVADSQAVIPTTILLRTPPSD